MSRFHSVCSWSAVMAASCLFLAPADAVQDEPEIEFLRANVPHLRITNLWTMTGNVSLSTNDGYTIEDLRGVELDPAPHVLTHDTNYPAQYQDGYPLGEGPYVSPGIAPFRLRHFTYEFSYGAPYSARMYDYAVTHGFSVIAGYGSQAAVAPDVRGLWWAGFSWWEYFASNGWYYSYDGGDTRYDYLMDRDVTTEIMDRVPDYGGNACAMLDQEYPGPFWPFQLQEKSWYPTNGTPAEKQAFEDKYYAGWVRTMSAPIEAMHRKGWPSVGVYPQHYDATWSHFINECMADSSYSGLPEPARISFFDRYGPGFIAAQDVLYPDQYMFWLVPGNAAYHAARLDHDLVYVNRVLPRKPVRPYIWPRLHGGDLNAHWWNQQPLPNEDARATSALMAFCGADGLAIWEWVSTNDMFHAPPLWVDGYSTCGLVIPVDGGVGNDIMLKDGFALWPDGADTNSTQPTQFKRYDVIAVSNISAEGMVKFQRIDPIADALTDRFVGWRPFFQMHRDALIPHLRPPVESIRGYIEGMAVIQPLERLLKQGEVTVDIPSIRQFYHELPIVRRVRTPQYDILMTYDPKAIWGFALRSIVLSNYAGRAGVNLTLPADAQTRIFILRHNPGSPATITGPAIDIAGSSATLTGNLSVTGSTPTSVSFFWGEADGGITKALWARSTALGVVPAGRVSTSITGLVAGTTYFYRSYASNSLAAGWAAETRSFVAATNGSSESFVSVPSVDDAEEGLAGAMDLYDGELDLGHTFRIREIGVADPADDVEEFPGGLVDAISSDHELVLESVSASVPVASGADDGEEYLTDGTVLLDSSDLELTRDVYVGGSRPSDQCVAIRFANTRIPSNAVIRSAWIQFAVKDTNDVDPCALTIDAVAAPNSAPLGTNRYALSTLPLLGAPVAWAPPRWTATNETGVTQRTPDLAPLIRALLTQPGWQTNSAATFILRGTGRRNAWSYETSAALAPTLHIEWGLEQLSGLRFTHVRIPPGATVNAAWLQFTAKDTNSLDPCALTIDCMYTGHALPFLTNAFAVSSLSLRGAPVVWSPLPWNVAGEAGAAQRTPDLSGLVQALVDRPDWQDDNAMLFVVGGVGRRNAWSKDGNGGLTPPVLHIEWSIQQTVGLRFGSVAVPRRAGIKSATIRFTVEEPASGTTTLSIRGEKKTFPAMPGADASNLTARACTSAEVRWNVSDWLTAGVSGPDQETPDLRAIVQELVNDPAWGSGNPMSFILSGSGARRAWAREGNGGVGMASLYIELDTPALTPADLDGDQMADLWEVQWFGSTNAVAAAPLADPDGDGVRNRDEYILGTAPTTGSGELQLSIAFTNGSPAITYPTVSPAGTAYEGMRRYYDVLSTTGLSGQVWLEVPGAVDVPGDGLPKTVVTTPDSGRVRFFRGQVRLEPPLLDY